MTFNQASIVQAIEALKEQLGDRLSVAQSVREQHGHTTTRMANQPPDAVIFAKSTEEISSIMQTCHKLGCPVIAFGTGSSLEGHVNAPHGGISIDMSQLNQIIEVNNEDLDVVVQPGVTREWLNNYLRDSGLFFPIDPGANASIGGMAATGASGTNAVRYGTMRDNILGMQVVMADGRIVRVGGRARKSSAGYDLTRLFIGSEGTLGIITELTLRLHGIPEVIAGGICSFPNIHAANDPEQRTKLWKARHDAYWASLALIPGAKGYATDVCVPISNLASCVEETLKDINENGLTAPILGHVGDGNFHVLPLAMPDDDVMNDKISAFSKRLTTRALAFGGTCTGEHGIGQGKRDSLREEMGDAVDLMAGIKADFDPTGILNPGKVFT